MTEPETRSISRTDWRLLGLLFLLIFPLRLWLLHNTEVTARDSIGYIRYALRFENEPWQHVLKSSHQHPGYPVLVWLASLPIRWIDGPATPENMQLSTQLISLVASMLLILPMYFLGRQFFERPVCFWATLLFQYLPISAQHLSDGISEPAYLLLLTTALLQAIHAARERRLASCVLCGLATGLAYLIRPEGLLILPALGLVLMALQYRADRRCPWKQFFVCTTAMTLSAVLVGSVYVLATGRITNKLSALEILHNLTKYFVAMSPSLQEAWSRLTLLAVSFPMTTNKTLRLGRSVWALLAEMNQGFHYVASIPALLGVYWSFGSLRRHPGYWFLMAFCLLHSLILIELAMSVCYLSDRHVLALILSGCYFVVFGLQEMVRRVLSWSKIASRADVSISWYRTWWRSATVWFLVLFLALVGFCLPKSTQRLHGNRVGNHLAGKWLAEKLKEGDIILDDHSWSHYFAGGVFQEQHVPVLPADLTPTCYVVVTRSRDPQLDLQRQQGVLSGNAEVVYQWPQGCDPHQARIVVYAQPRSYEKNRWHKAAPP